jgi:hypothetical protein
MTDDCTWQPRAAAVTGLTAGPNCGLSLAVLSRPVAREGRRFRNALKLSRLPHTNLDQFDFAFNPA